MVCSDVSDDYVPLMVTYVTTRFVLCPIKVHMKNESCGSNIGRDHVVTGQQTISKHMSLGDIYGQPV